MIQWLRSLFCRHQWTRIDTVHLYDDTDDDDRHPTMSEYVREGCHKCKSLRFRKL